MSATPISANLLSELSPPPFSNACRPVAEDVLELPSYRKGVDHSSQKPERQLVRYCVPHERAFRNDFECMKMPPGAVGTDDLDVREPLWRFVVNDPALPRRGHPVPSDGIVELRPLKHRRLFLPVLHDELEPVWRDIE